MVPLLSIHGGRTRYADAWELQKQLWSLRYEGSLSDVLFLTEHEHVYTLGKSAVDDHLLASAEELSGRGIEVYHIDRGGDITYHGPGQIVGYPILDLRSYKEDVHWYIRMLEQVIIMALKDFGIEGKREEGLTGVWVGDEKIAAIGVKISRWITMHGFALNVNTDLTMFGRIIPCGIFHKGVTSMEKILHSSLPLEKVMEAIEKSFSNVFGCSLTRVSKEEIFQSFTTVQK